MDFAQFERGVRDGLKIKNLHMRMTLSDDGLHIVCQTHDHRHECWILVTWETMRKTNRDMSYYVDRVVQHMAPYIKDAQAS